MISQRNDENRNRRDPEVSILMPVFNESKDFLIYSINSILKQSFSDFEFVIVDDGSTDSITITTLERVAMNDPRVRLFKIGHVGNYRARNFGLSQCRGEFVCFQDSDDWSEPNRIEAQVYFLRLEKSLGVVGVYQAEHQEDGRPLWICEYPTQPCEIIEAFKKSNPFCHPSVCVRASIAKQIGGYREIFDCAGDYDFLWRLCEYSRGANIPQPLYHYRRRHKSITSLNNNRKLVTLQAVRAIAEQRQMGLKEDIWKALSEAEAYFSIQIDKSVANHGDLMMFAGYYWSAARDYLSALSSAPFDMILYMKLLRLPIFIAFPFIRYLLVRPKAYRVVRYKGDKYSLG